MKYIGETSQALRYQFNSHKNAIKREKDTLLYKHFRKDHVHRSKAIEDLIEIQVVEKIFDPDVATQLDKKFTERRLNREYYWMVSLFTVFPYGLNDKVKGFGSVWSNNDVREKFNHHLAFKGIHVWLGRRRQRKRRRITPRDVRLQVDNLFGKLERQELKKPVTLRQAFQSFDVKTQNAILRDIRFQDLTYCDKLLLSKFREFRQIEKVGSLWEKSKNISKRFMLKLRFENKWMEEIYLSSIFNNTEVKKCIPSGCKFTDSPVIIYTYNRNIGSYILNYSRVLKDFDMEEFSEMEEIE